MAHPTFRLAAGRILVAGLLATALAAGPAVAADWGFVTPLVTEALADGATPLGDLDVRGWARGLLAQWPTPAQGSRPGRIHAAIVRGRLQRFAGGKPVPMSRPGVLLTAWRAARG